MIFYAKRQKEKRIRTKENGINNTSKGIESELIFSK